MTTLTIDLPNSLAQEAKDARLLAPSVIEALLCETLRRGGPSTACSRRQTSRQLPICNP